MAKKQQLWTPLDYVHFMAGWPAPENEPEMQAIPVPTPVYMPNPRTIDESAMFGDGFGGGNPYEDASRSFLPPPVATEPPDGMSGFGGMFAPDGGAFG